MLNIFKTVLILVALSPSTTTTLEVSYDVNLDALNHEGDYYEHGFFQHTHTTALDEENYMVLSWTPNNDKKIIVFTIEAHTLGWLGFGISPNGQMNKADIMTAWISNGQLHLQDRHGVGHDAPLDEVGNWYPMWAKENSTHTVVTVARRFDTCDPSDYELTNETTRFIYAWGDEDPKQDTIPYHGPARGVKLALSLLPFHKPHSTNDYQVWTVRQTITVPRDKDTFYWCHIEKVPEGKHKLHYVGFNMVYGENAYAHLHHSVAFECQNPKRDQPSSTIFEQYVGKKGYECYVPSMPESFNWCEKFFINWAIGSEGEWLPDDVGVPMGERHGGSTYLLFQTHYDNYKKEKDVSVNWEMEIYFTDNVRPKEAGILALGHAINFGLTVPPGVNSWITSGHCSEHCTEKSIPESGINVFMVFLHAHYLGRSISLRLFRQGIEMPVVMKESNYNANFQQARVLPQELKLLPGDHLTVECEYDSSDRKNATFSGWKAEDEMCGAFLSYYPRVDLALCRSSPSLHTIRTAFQIPPFVGNIDLRDYILDPPLQGGRHYQETINNLAWSRFSEPEIQIIHDKLAYGEHFIKCQLNGRVPLKIEYNTTQYPDTVLYKVEDHHCEEGDEADFEYLYHSSAATVFLIFPAIALTASYFTLAAATVN